ncbi:unnamed protein product [Citrullus colocynthis]|uniref:Uncharacterized protein n=1 Tax=Citrullus colocynthis TaxID=252529 RepID=A0ABP0XYN6_9ROSI
MHEFECRKQFDELNLDVVYFVKLSPNLLLPSITATLPPPVLRSYITLGFHLCLNLIGAKWINSPFHLFPILSGFYTSFTFPSLILLRCSVPDSLLAQIACFLKSLLLFSDFFPTFVRQLEKKLILKG